VSSHRVRRVMVVKSCLKDVFFLFYHGKSWPSSKLDGGPIVSGDTRMNQARRG